MKLDSKIIRKTNPLASRVDDDLVIFSAEKGMYYGTQAVGSRVWSLIEQETTVASVCDQLMQEFEVDRDTCEREVVAFLGYLEQEELVLVR